jgi:hypothetical protein
MKIIFVYNADSGFINSILDIGHKIISPNTYKCSLCNMTYGVMSEREEWKRFRESSKDELEFLHKDEFEKKYKEKREYPIILKINGANRLDELISKDDLNKMKNVNELIQKLKET